MKVSTETIHCFKIFAGMPCDGTGINKIDIIRDLGILIEDFPKLRLTCKDEGQHGNKGPKVPGDADLMKITF